MLAQAFTPAVNQDGYSHLTYIGSESISQVFPVTNTKGEVLGVRERLMIKLNFEVKGYNRGTTNIVALTVGGVYSDTSKLKQALLAMGFQAPESVLDEDGFFVETDPDELTEAFNDFLVDAVSCPYISRLYKSLDRKDRGWQIQLETLQPFLH